MKCSVLLSTHGQSAVRSDHDAALGSACRGSAVIKHGRNFLNVILNYTFFQ